MELEEHHRWKDMMWLEQYSLGLPSNLGILEGSLVGILGQLGSWKMGSLIKIFKSWRFIPTMKSIEGWLALSPAFIPAMVELGLDEDELEEEELVSELDEPTPLYGKEDEDLQEELLEYEELEPQDRLAGTH
jgi:hypothetical protein